MPGIRFSSRGTHESAQVYSDSHLTQPAKVNVEQDGSVTVVSLAVVSLAQKGPAEQMQMTVEQETLKAAAEISKWTITKTALRSHLRDAYDLRHQKADAQLALMTNEAMTAEFNSVVSKLSADLVGITVTSIGVVILPQLALTFTINLAKSVHHIRRLVDLVKEFHQRGLSVPKKEIPIKCATGALVKLAILALTLGHADFVSDLVGLDFLHTLFDSIFDPAQAGLDTWAPTLQNAAAAHAQWLAEHPHIQSIQAFFSAPVDVVKGYLFPDPAVDALQWTWSAGEGGESVGQVGQMLVQDGLANGHSAALETAEIVVDTNLANALAEHGADYLLQAPVERIEDVAEEQHQRRPSKPRRFNWAK